MLLKVGDCFQTPTGTTLTSVPPVPCGSPHTAQLYQLYTTDGYQCDPSVLISPVPTGTSGFELFTFVERDGSTVSGCVLITGSTTGSAMKPQ
jgi:hypothetical protein